ncbi:hypothetical protein [Oricola thermophila]|uniref:ThuA domain-containing protein n=1 Tax=Oricola thermophila TaxID=2742145 RepID=A0A6N1VDP4_9HYPH|nr:hypothetical protein [Oricola thermophila]QKV18653.1 hypothetical protein HTY61_09440 [Oricola thermophila]
MNQAHVVFVLSTDAPMPAVFDGAEGAGRVRPIRQDRLAPDVILAASGLIVTTSVDQIDLLRKGDAIEGFLDRGGRMVINGHVLRPYVRDLRPFVPLEAPHRPDFALTRLADHPVFEGIPARALETNRGVAGFYGRGHNPPPEGAVALTGIGPDRLPVDWTWRRPAGGALFVHSGNDLWGVGDDPAIKRRIAERLVDWCLAETRAEVEA